MTEIVCQDTSDAPTESPLYDIQTNPVPTKSIIYGPIVDVERFSDYWLDLLSVIPPAGITFGLLGYLCNMPKIPKNPRNKSLFSPNSPSHRRNPYSYTMARSLAPVWVDGAAGLGILSHFMLVGRLEEHGARRLQHALETFTGRIGP